MWFRTRRSGQQTSAPTPQDAVDPIRLIHQRNGRWTNYPLDDASVKTRVPIGPFLSMESAFEEAYRVTLGDAD
jgi:hypothetical protein